MGGFILAGGHPHDSGTLLLTTPDPSKKDTYSEPIKMTNFEFRIHLLKSLKKYMMFAMWGTQDRFLLLYCISISVRFTVDIY